MRGYLNTFKVSLIEVENKALEISKAGHAPPRQRDQFCTHLAEGKSF